MLKVFYNFLIKIFYIPYCLIIFIRIYLGKEHKIKFKEKILKNKIKRPEGFLFWFHVASIGELTSIFPLIDFFLKKDLKLNFLITTVTLSSFNELERKYKNNKRIFHQFLPYDTNPLINNFFEIWKPNLISFVDSEIWPNFFLKIKREKANFILLNARITKKSFKRWSLVKNFASELLESVSMSISSNRETINYLNYFKAKNIKYFGNIKFCSVLNKPEEFGNNQFNQVSKKKIWCAVSIHPGEEKFCGQVHSILKMTDNNIMTIMIPRHLHRIKQISSNLKKMGLKVQVKNENDNIEYSSDIVIVNYYGSVKKYLGKFKYIFIGKSLLKKLEKDGGQNPIDAAKLGCYIYHGPYVYNFKEIYQYLDDHKYSEEINNPNIFANELHKNFQNKFEINKENIEKINTYSNEIFKNLIEEYDKYIYASKKT